jgi:hypothetical protein
MGVPYFLSAQLDGQARAGTADSWEVIEGGLGLFLNVMVWVTVTVLDIHLLAFEFTSIDSNQHVLQMAAVVTLALSGSAILFFTFVGLCNAHSFTSTTEHDANFLPPFATALIVGNLKATTLFSLLLLATQLLLVAETELSRVVLKLLVTQVALKTYGASLARNNQRLRGYSSNENVFSAQ